MRKQFTHDKFTHAIHMLIDFAALAAFVVVLLFIASVIAGE